MLFVFKMWLKRGQAVLTLIPTETSEQIAKQLICKQFWDQNMYLS